MKRKTRQPAWATVFKRSLATMTRIARNAAALSGAPVRKRARKTVQTRAGALSPAPKRVAARTQQAAGAPAWLPGLAVGPHGARRFRLFRPTGVGLGERLPLMVMLHGCGQDAEGFAASTRMNRIAARERFMVLYPEQDRLANAQGCWNWFDTAHGRAQGEAALIMNAIDQVCLLHPADRTRVAIAGLSAGASMAALLVSLHPGRFCAVVMHSGIPPGTAHSTLTALGAMHGRRATQPLAATAAAMQSTWPPLLVIHGTADGVVSPRNAQAAAQLWADAADAQAGPARRVQRGRRHAMAVTDYKRRGRTVATWVAIEGLAHAWSGGAASQAYSDAQGPDASRMAWAFAQKQFRG